MRGWNSELITSSNTRPGLLCITITVRLAPHIDLVVVSIESVFIYRKLYAQLVQSAALAHRKLEKWLEKSNFAYRVLDDH